MGMGASAAQQPKRRYMVEAPEVEDVQEEDPPSPVMRVGTEIENKGWICDFYTIEPMLLSKGAVSSVRRVTHKTKKQSRALKQYNLKRCEGSDGLKEQTNLMLSLGRHPNIVRLYETFEDKIYYYLVFEYCAGGRLFDHIVEEGCHTERETASAVQQVFRALDHMHSRNVIHRDVKPEHVVLKAKGNLYGSVAKLIDLNFACAVASASATLPYKDLLAKQKFFAAGEVSQYYKAPEVHKDGRLSMSSDCFSAGVIMYLLLLGFPKSASKTTRRLSLRKQTPESVVKEGRFMFMQSDWDSASEGARALLTGLLERDPSCRMAANAAVNHDWVKRQAPQPANERVQAQGGTGFATTRKVEVDMPAPRNSSIDD